MGRSRLRQPATRETHSTTRYWSAKINPTSPWQFASRLAGLFVAGFTFAGLVCLGLLGSLCRHYSALGSVLGSMLGSTLSSNPGSVWWAWWSALARLA